MCWGSPATNATAPGSACQVSFLPPGGEPRKVHSQSGANPYALGALLRIVYEGSRGPAREVHVGSGYWSVDGAIQVLGMEAGKRPVAVWVRWPGGAETQVPLEAGQREVIARVPR